MVTRYQSEPTQGEVEKEHLGVSFAIKSMTTVSDLLIIIIRSGYLDSGIERIVDQVLYPKMAGFQSQIETLVYSYLNIDRPKRKVIKQESVKEEFNTSSLLPKDLEAVSSPESDKNKSFGSQEYLDKQVDENDDEFESPAFEPLSGVVVETDIKKENNDDDSHLSGLSNMKSEGSEEEENSQKETVPQSQPMTFDRSMESIKQEEEDESQLSQVSSGSRLSIVVQSEKDSLSPKPEVLNITEEAQMPKFSENSNSIESRAPGKETVEGQSLFDFKKEEIEFKGPCRKQMTLDEKLKEEIYESENKHANIFKTDEIETNSHSSDMKLEIVEHNITESESRLKIDVDATSETGGVKENSLLPPPKLELSENEGKMEDKLKHSSPPDKSKDRSSHHKTAKSSKHSRDDKRSTSKHSSTHHSTSKSRHSDRHHSTSSSRHKSSSKPRDRHSSSSGKDKDKTSSKERHRSRSDHKSRDDKRHSDADRHTSRDKSGSTRRSPEQEMAQGTDEKKFDEEVVGHDLNQECDEVFEGVVEDIEKRYDMKVHLNQEFTEPNPMEEYNDSPFKAPVTTVASPVKVSKENASPKLESPNNDERTPKTSGRPSTQTTPDSLPKPLAHDFMSDEDDFYGFPENETLGTSTPHTTFTTPAKVTSDVTTPGPSTQKSVLNQSLVDEDSFYGFDDATPKKPTPSTSSSTKVEISKLPEVPKCSEGTSITATVEEVKTTGNGKRVRRPNTKYLSDEFTTHDDDEQEALGETARSSKKRKRITLDIVKITKKQKSEDKSVVEDVEQVDQSKSNEKPETSDEIEMPVLMPQVEDIPMPADIALEKHDETGEMQSKSSKKHSKHDRRSSARRK